MTDFKSSSMQQYARLFGLTPEEESRINKWLKEEAYPPLIEQQLKNPDLAGMLFEDENGKIKYPYLGAIGGGLTYEFTPTSLGTVVKVIFCSGMDCEKTLDLTDYDSW